MIDQIASFTGLPVNSPYLIFICTVFVVLVTVLLFDLFRFVFFGHRG